MMTAANYDRLSRFYDLLAGPGEARLMETGLRLLDAREGEAVLEIGSGTGRALIALARAVGRSGRVVGADLSAGMCAVARRRVRAAGLSDRIALIRADANHLPFAGGAFDAVFTSFTLELFDDEAILEVLRACRRALRQAGRLCVVALHQGRKPGVMPALYARAQRTWPELVDCRPIRAQDAIAAAGFNIQGRVELSLWGLPVKIVLAIPLTATAPAHPVTQR